MGFNADPDPAFFVNADSDPDPGFFTPWTGKKILLKLSSHFFLNIFTF